MDYYEKAGLWPVPGEARLPPRRLRLHHLHRQLRPAAGRDLRRGQRRRPGRGLGAVRQPQLRGPDQPGRQDELPGLAAAGDRLRARRHDGLRLRRASRSGTGHRRRAGVPARHLAVGRRRCRQVIDASINEDMFTDGLRRRVRRRRAVALAADARRATTFEWDPRLDLRAQAPVLRRHGSRSPSPVAGHRRRPGAGAAGRLGDHRPHLPRRLDQGRHPGRAVPRRARRRAARTSTPTAPAAATTR